ncbi:hypothetical protein ACA910_006793 [Epithemia clementina (nom. ined.)]
MEIWKTMTQAKWDNGKQHFKLYVDRLAQEEHPMFNYKTLRSDAGFLVHQAMTYSCLKPFLKGFFLTMNAWREDQGLDGWKMTPQEWVAYLSHKIESKEGLEASDHILEALEGMPGNQALTRNKPPPDTVALVEHFRTDIKVISQMFDSQTPLLISICSQEILVAIYGFGNASGKGFGLGIKLESGLSYRIGMWSTAKSEESSNWREFANCIKALETEASQGNLKGKEIFFFIDNSMVESCCYKGSSSSKKLLDLIIRLRSLEMTHAVRLHMTHMLGKRMMAQGTDGLSWGTTNEGVMSGTDMMSFIPLHLLAMERSRNLWDWVCSWLGADSEYFLPEDWFQKRHDISGWRPPEISELFEAPKLESGKFVWALPPGAANVALEELRKARIKRQSSTLVFIVQRLFTMRWFKQLHKAADLGYRSSSVYPFLG